MKWTYCSLPALAVLLGCALATPVAAQNARRGNPRPMAQSQTMMAAEMSPTVDQSYFIDDYRRPHFLTPFNVTSTGKWMPASMYMPGRYGADEYYDDYRRSLFLTPFNVPSSGKWTPVSMYMPGAYGGYQYVDDYRRPLFLTPFTITTYDFSQVFAAFFSTLNKTNDTLSRLDTLLDQILAAHPHAGAGN